MCDRSQSELTAIFSPGETISGITLPLHSRLKNVGAATGSSTRKLKSPWRDVTVESTTVRCCVVTISSRTVSWDKPENMPSIRAFLP
ncbi:MAG: hypothetical protein ACLTTP_10115 [Alistipes ihumii]